MKTLSNDRPIAALLGVPNLFLAEGHVYDKILPVLGDFGPPCIYFDPETIIMEDLAEKGYVNCDRRKFLDFEHTACALKVHAYFRTSLRNFEPLACRVILSYILIYLIAIAAR